MIVWKSRASNGARPRDNGLGRRATRLLNERSGALHYSRLRNAGAPWLAPKPIGAATYHCQIFVTLCNSSSRGAMWKTYCKIRLYHSAAACISVSAIVGIRFSRDVGICLSTKDATNKNPGCNGTILDAKKTKKPGKPGFLGYFRTIKDGLKGNLVPEEASISWSI
jgi:hypothetical protein